jgi:hypothetical protein
MERAHNIKRGCCKQHVKNIARSPGYTTGGKNSSPSIRRAFEQAYDATMVLGAVKIDFLLSNGRPAYTSKPSA